MRAAGCDRLILTRNGWWSRSAESQVERNGFLASITGFPAITVPAGFPRVACPSASNCLGSRTRSLRCSSLRLRTRGERTIGGRQLRRRKAPRQGVAPTQVANASRLDILSGPESRMRWSSALCGVLLLRDAPGIAHWLIREEKKP